MLPGARTALAVSIALTKLSQERAPGAGHPPALPDFPLSAAEDVTQLHQCPLLPAAPPVAAEMLGASGSTQQSLGGGCGAGQCRAQGATAAGGANYQPANEGVPAQPLT